MELLSRRPYLALRLSLHRAKWIFIKQRFRRDGISQLASAAHASPEENRRSGPGSCKCSSCRATGFTRRPCLLCPDAWQASPLSRLRRHLTHPLRCSLLPAPCRLRTEPAPVPAGLRRLPLPEPHSRRHACGCFASLLFVSPSERTLHWALWSIFRADRVSGTEQVLNEYLWDDRTTV